MSRLSFLIKGAPVCALILNCVLMNTAFGQPGGAGAQEKVAVVAGKVGETLPVAKKKYVGNVEAINQVDSVARVSGTLSIAPGFDEGSHVKKGQLLFEIDPVPYQAKVDAAKAAIEQTKARIEYAQSNYNRLNDLYERNAGSKDDKESAFANLKSLEAELLSANAQLVLAEEDLKYTKIFAELDGRAGRRAYSAGSYVSPQSSALVRVVQTDPIYVRFTMSERDYISMFGNADALKATSSISLTLPNDETYPESGEISFVDNTVKSTTDTIKIWAKFPNPNETLSPGGVVTVNLTKKDTENAASVEPSAILFDNAGPFVYVLVDSISDEDLYKEIGADARYKKAIEAVENGEKSKEEFMAEFKAEHFQQIDPKTKKVVADFFVDNKVDSKYLMTLRRNVTLGPSTSSATSIYSGIKAGDIVMMDGVNKARPFDLVRPFYRGEDGKAREKASPEAQSTAVKDAKSSQSTKPAVEAKRIESKKQKLASSAKNSGVGA